MSCVPGAQEIQSANIGIAFLVICVLLGGGCSPRLKHGSGCPASVTKVGSGKHLFILSGQSNMVGLKPSVSFTPAVAEAFGTENIIIVKDAVSGASIRSWCKRNLEDPPPTVGRIPKVRGEYYGRLMTKVNAAIEGKSVQTVTFVWMQGESDLRNPEYHAYLPELIDQLQNDLGRKDINVVIGRISDCGLDQKKRIQEKKYIRRTQVEFAESYRRGAWVDTDDLNDRVVDGKIVHDLHYTAEGYKVLGQRFAEAAIVCIGLKISSEGNTVAGNRIDGTYGREFMWIRRKDANNVEDNLYEVPE